MSQRENIIHIASRNEPSICSFKMHVKLISASGWALSLEARNRAIRLGFGAQGWDLSPEAGI